jgi:hypothetical protein
MIKFSDCLIEVTAWASLTSLIGVFQFRNNFFACIMKRKFKGCIVIGDPIIKRERVVIPLHGLPLPYFDACVQWFELRGGC